jgi:hypothetical protein
MKEGGHFKEFFKGMRADIFVAVLCGSGRVGHVYQCSLLGC